MSTPAQSIYVRAAQFLRDRTQLIGLALSQGWRSVGLVATSLLLSLVPAAQAVVTGRLIAGIDPAVSGGPREWLVPLGILGLLFLIDEVLGSVRQFSSSQVSAYVDEVYRRDIRRLVGRVRDLRALEAPEFLDDVARASDVGDGRRRSPGTAAIGQMVLTFRVISALAAGVVVASFSPVLAVALFVLAVATRGLIHKFWIGLEHGWDAREWAKRRMNYWNDVASTEPAGKEVRLFGLAKWVVERRSREYIVWSGDMLETLRGILRQQWIIILVTLVAFVALLYFPGDAALRGDIPIGQLATILVAGIGVYGIGYLGYESYDIDYGLGAVRAMNRLRSNDHPVAPAQDVDVPRMHSGDSAFVRLQSISFTYPKSETPVIEGLDLEIGRHEVVGIVGPNGAGKTTLIKILAGLYPPDDGHLVVNGTALGPQDMTAWRKRVAVVMQDFTKYPMTVAENIGLSAPEAMADREGIQRAAQLAGFAAIADSLPQSYDTILARYRPDGLDLSGGQWQRLALARAIFATQHGRQLLILDEPTSNLDVAAEATFYEDVVRSIRDASIVLISHRLSTVRHSDRILLVDEGRIVEEGSHESLLAAGEQYATMFALQAARFLEEENS